MCSDLAQAATQDPQPRRRMMIWWPMLIAPAGLLVSVAISLLDDRLFQRFQTTLEAPAPFLVGLTCVVYLTRAAIQRNVLFALLGALAAAMVLREAHDLPGLDFMRTGIYVALGAVGVCGVLFGRRILTELRADWRHTSWLGATFLAYFLAVLVMRRAFRFVPGEHHVHRSLEECAETVAHAMFIVTSLVAGWRRTAAGGASD